MTIQDEVKRIKEESQNQKDKIRESIKKLNFERFCEIVKELYRKNKKKKGQILIVTYLLDIFHFRTPEDYKEIFIYDGGIYFNTGQVFLERKIQEILGREHCSNNIVNEIIGHIRRSSYISREKFIEPLNYICLENGLLNIDTLLLEEFTPDLIFLNKLPVYFMPAVDCPLIKKFLKEVLIEKEFWDKEDVDLSDLNTIQEFCGFLLLKNMRFNRALMFYGEGENGKSTLINLIKKFLGEKNVSNVPIQKLEKDKFAVASLHGKLANLHSDLPKTAMKETSVFKQLSGGDSVDGEKKFRDNFSFLNYAKMIYAANALPIIYDDSRAFWRRLIIFKFPNQFPEDNENTNKNLLKELTIKEELSGFLNWSIDGLKRLLRNEKFTMNKSTLEIREEYIRLSDSIGAFIIDCVEEVPGEYVVKRDLYEAYVEYCREKGYDPYAENSFHRKFHVKVKVREIQPTIEVNGRNKQVKAWGGIKLKKKWSEGLV